MDSERGSDASEVGDAACHLATGERHVIKIVDIAFGGAGVARIDGFVVFVPYVALEEEVEVELTEVKKRYARARLVQIIDPSNERTEPRCRYFGACGGCQYQHLEYPTQLRLKEKQLRDLLKRLGGIEDSVVRPIVACPQPYGYRNRLLVRSQWNKPEQRLVVGFLRHDNHYVEDIEECAIAEPGLNEQLRNVRLNPPPRGGLKVSLRIGTEDWDVPPDSFFQNNYFMLRLLLEVVSDCVKDSGAAHLLDAYCGVGFFGIELASQVESFAGVECDQRAIRAARRNAKAHGVSNGEFVVGNTEEVLPELLDRFEASQTTVLLDPPRVGCRPEAVETLRASRPFQILYISCHPATLARDVKALCAEGLYRLEQVTPLDMFPQTQHIECVADLRLR